MEFTDSVQKMVKSGIGGIYPSIEGKNLKTKTLNKPFTTFPLHYLMFGMTLIWTIGITTSSI